MRKLLKKKGFTFVELIVVLAIMAIMLTMLIPMLSANTALEDEMCDYAKAFYSNVQELMTDERVKGTPLPNTASLNFVYVKVSEGTTSTLADVEVKMGPHTSEPAELEANSPWQEFALGLAKLQKYNNKTLYYYAVVDNKYRVVFTYCSLGDFSTVMGKTFDEECYANSTLTGAYPREYAGVGAVAGLDEAPTT